MLDQLWVNFDVDHRAFVTVGRQHVKWGVGKFWNPTDYLHPVKRDPLATFDTRTGTTLVKLHVPWEKRGWNLYAVGLLEDAGGDTGQPTNRLGRRSALAPGPSWCSAPPSWGSTSWPRTGTTRAGASTSPAAWATSTSTREVALRTGGDGPRWQRDAAPAPGPLASLTGWERDPRERLTPQVVAGGDLVLQVLGRGRAHRRRRVLLQLTWATTAPPSTRSCSSARRSSTAPPSSSRTRRAYQLVLPRQALRRRQPDPPQARPLERPDRGPHHARQPVGPELAHPARLLGAGPHLPDRRGLGRRPLRPARAASSASPSPPTSPAWSRPPTAARPIPPVRRWWTWGSRCGWRSRLARLPGLTRSRDRAWPGERPAPGRSGQQRWPGPARPGRRARRAASPGGAFRR